ncbi:transposable element Tcb1 transposase [Trichonephila clavipes]|nr:transposable element Tcb1 transposase [Trichonephila clavipes]
MPGKRARTHFSQLNEFERGLIIGMKTAGWSTCRDAGQVDRLECAVRNCWEEWTREGTKARKTRSGVTSDESRFVSRTDDNRVWVRRRPGERVSVTISPSHCSRHTARMAGVMVWWAIAYAILSTLIVIRRTLTSQRYVDDILRPHVGPFLNGLPEVIFQQDNTRPHTARVAQDFLRHFKTLPWPARSPDLSPAGHVWDQLKRQIPSCHYDLEFAV